MEALSLDLRERIVAAVDRGDRTKAQIAVDFDISERQVYKLLALRREQGTLQPKGHGGGNPGKVEAKHRRLLERLISKQPDATLQELRDQLHTRSGLFVSITTLWQMCRDLDLSVKKNPRSPRKPATTSAAPSPSVKKASSAAT